MQPVTVAVADADSARRTRYEHSVRDEHGVSMLSDGASSNDAYFEPRRTHSRANISVTENEVARARRLMPRILLVDLNLCEDINFSVLSTLHRECPDTYVVLIVDDDSAISENFIMQAIEDGVRGYIGRQTSHQILSKVAEVVDRGEIWASRKMLGKIMDRVLNNET